MSNESRPSGSGIESHGLRTINHHQIAASLHDAGQRRMVVFCHGFRGSSLGPQRLFVRAARELAAQGISSLRFDQYGCGNSEGDFIDSSFDDWLATIAAIAREYLDQGYAVALWGQSMGAAASIVTASNLPLSGVVAWVPDPNIDPFVPSGAGYSEEAGQLIQDSFWQEAVAADVAGRLREAACPMYIVQCTNDEFVDQRNREAIETAARPQHQIDTFEGLAHSAWTHAQATTIIDRSVAFLSRVLAGTPAQ